MKALIIILAVLAAFAAVTALAIRQSPTRTVRGLCSFALALGSLAIVFGAFEPRVFANLNTVDPSAGAGVFGIVIGSLAVIIAAVAGLSSLRARPDLDDPIQ